MAMKPEQEIVTKEKQQVQGTEATRPGRYYGRTLISVSILTN